MTRDEVIALAKQCGHWSGATIEMNDVGLERFAALIEEHLKSQGYRQCAKGQRTTQFCGMLQEAVKAEREACAKVCEEFCDDPYAVLTAERIRRRNQE